MLRVTSSFIYPHWQHGWLYRLIRGHPGEYDGYHPDIVGETCTADPYGIKDEPTEVDPSWGCNDIYAVKAEGHVMLFDVMSKW